MQRDIWTRLKSRKFLMALANLLFIVVNEVLDRPVDPGAYWAITGGIIAFILGESYVDGQHYDHDAAP
jgi:hypothetical protein